MSAAEIITEIYNSRFIERYSWQFMKNAEMINREDIIQEIYLMLCEVEGGRLCGIYEGGGMNAVMRYVSGLVVRQLRSDNSKVYWKYTLRTQRELSIGDFRAWYNETAEKTFWDDYIPSPQRRCETLNIEAV